MFKHPIPMSAKVPTKKEKAVSAATAAAVSVSKKKDKAVATAAAAAAAAAVSVSEVAESGREQPQGREPPKVLTKYERTQVIGLRSEWLARGAQPFVEVDPRNRETVFEIAERELDARRLPFTVVRNLPDGKTEHLRLAAK
jgi:DNA-directed RNA polymerase subunit K/omega